MNALNKNDVTKAIKHFQFLLKPESKITGVEFAQVIRQNYPDMITFKYAAAVSKYCVYVSREKGKIYIQFKSDAHLRRELAAA